MTKPVHFYTFLLILLFALPLFSFGQTNLEAKEAIREKLCSQWGFSETDTKKCPDSVHFEQFDRGNLYLTQSFYGSGYGNGVWINLIKVKPESILILDSLFTSWESDLFTPEKINCDHINDWFTYTSEGSGTNHFSRNKTFLRIQGDSLAELFTYPQYVSDMDVEGKPMTFQSIETEIISASMEQIVLQATYNEGKIIRDKEKIQKTIIDQAIFQFSGSCHCFVWKSSTEKAFEKVWKEAGMRYPGK